MAALVRLTGSRALLVVPAAATLALALGGPSAAWASHGSDHGSVHGGDHSSSQGNNASSQGTSSSAGSANHGSSRGTSSSSSAASASSGSSRGASSSSSARSSGHVTHHDNRANHDNGRGTGSKDGPRSEAGADRGEAGQGGKGSGAAAQPASADPAGNNGTIKIDGLPLDDGMGNEPHVGCAFAVTFFNFDDGQTADITFTGKPPSGPQGVLLSQSGVPISDDPAGGGQDVDAVLTYTAAQLGLTGTSPSAQGWHVKVAVDAVEAPGGAKQKVFWLDCDTTPEVPPAGPASGSGVITPPTAPVEIGAPVEAVSADAGGLVSRTSLDTAAAAPDAAVAAAFAEVASAARLGRSASPAARPGLLGGLPTTGADVTALVLLGLAAVGVGGAGVVAGRKTRVPSLA